MILKKRIPKDFYKLFNTKNRDYYMLFLEKIYEQNNEVYTSLGLTIEECRIIVEDTIIKSKIVLEEEMEEGMEQDNPFLENTPSGILNRIISWGWLKSDFDEKLNTYVISFPRYSQLYVELFITINKEDDSKERENILSIYSALFTYHSDTEKNNDILVNAVRTSRSLGQLLSNMQDGMRSYFDELSNRKDFLGIQEVLVEEINNSDSKKYAILTTTDSFYRYKEAVKELISQILKDNDSRREALEKAGKDLVTGSVEQKRNEYSRTYYEEASQYVYQVEREFDLIERKYNKLIEQKAVFAQRALARIHYILQEGNNDDNNIVKLLNLLDVSEQREEILEELRDRMKFTTQYKVISDSSFYNRRNREEQEFTPLMVNRDEGVNKEDMTDFVPKPLYTQKQLRSFREKNTRDGVFTATESTVQSVEDLEKLLFIWQEATDNRLEDDRVELGNELTSGEGFKFSQIKINKE